MMETVKEILAIMLPVVTIIYMVFMVAEKLYTLQKSKTTKLSNSKRENANRRIPKYRKSETSTVTDESSLIKTKVFLIICFIFVITFIIGSVFLEVNKLYIIFSTICQTGFIISFLFYGVFTIINVLVTGVFDSISTNVSSKEEGADS